MNAGGDKDTVKPCVALGVTGSIAAYKSVDLASKLSRAGVSVHAVMTANACRLVTPLTFMTVSRNPVTDSLWEVPRWAPQHIDLADRVQLLVIAPATANIIGKLACGIGDDALSTFALSFRGPILLAPAMNPRMWSNPAVQENCQILQSRGVHFLGPERGPVACGDLEEAGRMSEPMVICNAVLASLQLLKTEVPRHPRRRVVITAGPTRESIDPVRFLSNRSSGRMGYALVECAVAAGHSVVLISGPTSLPPPVNCRVLSVTTADEMALAVKQEFTDSDVLIMSAAVADFRPSSVLAQKLKKSAIDPPPSLSLVATEDILSSVSSSKRPDQLLVGFAAETENLIENALVKLKKKQLDWLVANDVSRPGLGFDSEENEVLLFSSNGDSELMPRSSKLALAARILSRVLFGQA